MLEDEVRRINLLDHLEQQYPEVPLPPEEAAESWTEAQIHEHYLSNNQQPAPSVDAATGTPNAAAEESTSHDAINALEAAAGDACPDQPGGSRVQPERPELDPANAPPTLRQHQLTATVAGYRAAAIAHGIPFRWANAVLTMLLAVACDHVPDSLLGTTLQLSRSRRRTVRGVVTHRRHGLFPPGDALLAELKQQAGSHAFEKHMAGALSSYQPLPDGGWTTGDAACRAGFDLRMFYQSV